MRLSRDRLIRWSPGNRIHPRLRKLRAACRVSLPSCSMPVPQRRRPISRHFPLSRNRRQVIRMRRVSSRDSFPPKIRNRIALLRRCQACSALLLHRQRLRVRAPLRSREHPGSSPNSFPAGHLLAHRRLADHLLVQDGKGVDQSPRLHLISRIRPCLETHSAIRSRRGDRAQPASSRACSALSPTLRNHQAQSVQRVRVSIQSCSEFQIVHRTPRNLKKRPARHPLCPV